MIDDARPAGAIRGVTPPGCLPVFIGGNQHPLAPFEHLAQRHQRRTRMAAGHRVGALREEVRCGDEDGLLVQQSGENTRGGGVPLVALVPNRNEADGIEERPASRLVLVVTGGIIRLAIGIAAREDGVDFGEALLIDGRNLRRWLRFHDYTAALGKIHRLDGPEDPVFVDGVDGFHAGGSNTLRHSLQSLPRHRQDGKER